MTHEEAIAQAAQLRASEPGATWIVTERDGDWHVTRVGVAPVQVSGTATKPPPPAPRDDPHTPAERAAWFAAGG
jgi:hypothetical protein